MKVFSNDWRRDGAWLLVLIIAAVLLSGCSTIRQTCCWWTFGPPEVPEVIDVGELPERDRPAASREAGVTLVEAEPDMATLLFDFDESFLRPASRLWLRTELYPYLRDAPQIRIEIAGHTCDIGEAEYNIALGERRARAAKQFLIDLGIASSRIVIVSYGEEQPAHGARWRNRRDDFFIIDR